VANLVITPHHKIMKKTLMQLVRGYQTWVSPMLPPSCRYVPSCSQYSIEAIDRFGAGYGTWLTVKRICRCHPGYPGGYDPVPETRHLAKPNKPEN
jgi:uncharacterized protein